MSKKPQNERDTELARAAAKVILDGRDLIEPASVLVTLEHLVATVLIASFPDDASKAARILNEGLAPGVERRILMYVNNNKDYF